MGKSIKKLVKAVAMLPVTATKAAVNVAKTASGATAKSGSSSYATASTLANLTQEKEDNSKKRVRLYATKNEELGEEVEGIGASSKRGKLFDNQ